MTRQTDPDSDALAADLIDVAAVLRRVVSPRVRDRDAVDDIVQETLARVLAARPRLDGGTLGPYAIITARNLVTSDWRRLDTSKRYEHRLLDPREPSAPEESLLEREEAEAVGAALDRLAPRDRDALLAHELEGRDMMSLAQDLDSTPGAVAVRLSRSRAKLRVEYLLALDGEPPSSQCRPVLLALSAGDRRRQAELDAGYHILECPFCGALSERLLDRRSKPASGGVRIGVRADTDVVVARQRGRDVAVQAGLSTTEATVVATAISEVARNIVRFARGGAVTVRALSDDVPGVLVVAQDAGPGISDVELALTEGYTTYGGMGLGLPGCRRLMDEFEISSEVGRGTTVIMTKWHRS